MGWRETWVLAGVLFVFTFSGALGGLSFLDQHRGATALAPLPEGSAVATAALNLDPHTRSMVIAIMPDLPLQTVCIQAVPGKGVGRAFHARFINGQPVEAARWSQWGCQTAIRDRGEVVSIPEGMIRLAEARTSATSTPQRKHPALRG